jgi:3-deoxy-D-arabino-heptulosonate 7-phosphate (DAHP) synthase class II
MSAIQQSSEWSRDSWRSKPIVQDVIYPTISSIEPQSDAAVDQATYKRKQSMEQVVSKLNTLPPIVSAVEVSLA